MFPNFVHGKDIVWLYNVYTHTITWQYGIILTIITHTHTHTHSVTSMVDMHKQTVKPVC